MTVVRNEFELGENDPASVLEERVLSTAYLWHNYGQAPSARARTSRTFPSIGCRRSTAATISPTTPCCSSPASSTRRRRSRRFRRCSAAIPKPDARAAEDLHAGAGAGRRAQRDAAARRRRRRGARRLSRARGLASGRRGARRPAAACSATRRRAGCTRRSSRRRRRRASAARSYQLRDPGLLARRRRRAQGAVARRSARHHARDARRAAGASGDRGGSRPRARRRMLKNIELALNDAHRVGLQMSEWIAQGDWRLFFLHRDRLRAVTPADVNRVAQAYLKPTNRTVGVFIPTEKPDRAQIPAAPSIDVAGQGLQGRCAGRGGRGVRSVARPTSRRARSASALATASRWRCCRRRRAAARWSSARDAALRRREEPVRNGRRRRRMAGAMLMRGTTAHTRQQIRERARPAEGARRTSAAAPTQATLQIETTRENLPADADADGGDPAAARVLRRRSSTAQAGAAGRDRGSSERAAGDRRRSSSRAT